MVESPVWIIRHGKFIARTGALVVMVSVTLFIANAVMDFTPYNNVLIGVLVIGACMCMLGMLIEENK